MIVALFPELQGIGGVQLAGRETAAALAALARERGWDCRFLSLNDPAGEHSMRCGEQDVSFLGFHRVKFRFVLAALRLAHSKPKMILAAHPNLALPAWISQKMSPGTRTIVMTHGVEVWRSLFWLRRRALCHADLVLAPSADTARKAISVQGVAESRVRRLPWCLDPEFLALVARANALLLPTGFPSGLTLLTVGRWDSSERYKGADRLIEVMPVLLATLPDLHLVAVGHGDDLPRLERIAKAQHITERVHFLSGLSREELVACYAACDVFALPSGGEGFGFVFLEAMALGKPVIGGERGGITDIVEHGKSGFLVPPENVEGLVEALKRLLRDRKLREEMGAYARARTLAQYTFEEFRNHLGVLLDVEYLRVRGS